MVRISHRNSAVIKLDTMNTHTMISRTVDNHTRNNNLCSTMPDLRDAVLKELERRKWTHYRLVQELKGKRADGKDIPPGTVYQFLRGDTAINIRDLGIIFDVLGLEFRRKK